jgi:hypothetical protein
MASAVKPGSMVNSTIGKRRLDRTGSAVGASRMDPAESYTHNAGLLKEYIDKGSESAWKEIKRRIDNIYATVSNAMESLDAEAPFSKDINKQIKSGKRLFFKPNLVTLPVIDYYTHDLGIPGCNSPWEFIAAVMRWFHDKGGITYHQMAVGEAGLTTTPGAMIASEIAGKTVTREAVYEGKYGSFYGGWGFYFARKYLAECHNPEHKDDPMSGYQESLEGLVIPPGLAPGKLLLYELNRVGGDNGRDVPVVDGVNWKSITMHKAVIGGDPDNPEDRRRWPGCVLVNIPKLKIHTNELFTCAMKNLGMGLYPLEANASKVPGKYEWKYAAPNLEKPLCKIGLPHGRWTLESDPVTFLPRRDSKGNYLWKRTGGMEANLGDALQAVTGQKITMLHVVDAIECCNINHSSLDGVRVPEGLVFAGSDVVAIDTCCSRYMFNMVPMEKTAEIQKKYGIKSDVIHKVPLPHIEGKNIVNGEGYDSSFSRYHAIQHCEDRGLGQQKFYIAGNDLWQGGNLASLRQHLGRVDNGVFTELLTKTVYYCPLKPLYDFQSTVFAYLELNDALTGSDYKKQLLEAYDDNGDGVIDYLETGKMGGLGTFGYLMGLMWQKIEPGKAMKLRFVMTALQAKLTRTEWNTWGHNLGERALINQAISRAFAMAQSREEQMDPLFPGRTWGNGKWPSVQMVLQQQHYARVYGQTFPNRFDTTMSPYAMAFQYADLKCNKSKYCTQQAMGRNEDIIGNYHRSVTQGTPPLPFTLYVPRGLGSWNGKPIPNVEETDDPELVFTVCFEGDKEVWKELWLSEYNLK